MTRQETQALNLLNSNIRKSKVVACYSNFETDFDAEELAKFDELADSASWLAGGHEGRDYLNLCYKQVRDDLFEVFITSRGNICTAYRLGVFSREALDELYIAWCLKY